MPHLQGIRPLGKVQELLNYIDTQVYGSIHVHSLGPVGDFLDWIVV